MRLKRFAATLVLATASLAALALPTVDAVQAEVQRGNYAQAEAMMHEVVAAKPGSAKAHYVYAEILAHNRRFALAAAEAARARQADPAIGFTDPAKFAALEQLLEREQQAARQAASPARPDYAVAQSRPQAPAPGVPAWVWVFGLAGIAAVVWVVVSRRQQAQAAPAGFGANALAGTVPAPYGTGYAPGYGQPTAPGGTGLMGVGLAAAGGVAAGMLAERLLHGGSAANAAGTGMGGAGGLVPGTFDDMPADDGAARELEQRPIDFGSGDGWGGDAGTVDGAGDDGW